MPNNWLLRNREDATLKPPPIASPRSTSRAPRSTDCEYNRQGDEGGRKKAVLNVYELPKAVDPDIIVHQRGPDGPNLPVIEVKPASSDENDKEHDRRKLQAYLEKPHSYTFVVFLTYECKEKAGRYEIQRIEPRRDKWRKG